MAITKRAHMVSRSYLDEWADGKGVVDVADLVKGVSITTTIGNATVVSYAYRTEVMPTDLEAQFGKIESAGVSALRKFREAHKLAENELKNAIAFLDMHRERGLYADQTKTRAPAILLMKDGSLQKTQLPLGDRMVLASYMNEGIQLNQLGIEKWPWTIWNAKEVLTGDGALVFWREAGSTEPTTITFPLSPTEVLVIGRRLNSPVDINMVMAMKSRRWLIARRGGINKKLISDFVGNHHPGSPRWIPLKKQGFTLDLEVY